MKSKIWHKVTISNESQDIEVYPDEEFEGIILHIREADKSKDLRVYLSAEEMEFLILKLREMMNYVKQE